MTCKLIIRITFFLASIIVLPTLSLGAKDGAALYKSKCAHCHGTGGEGKPAMKAPALKGTTLTPDQIGQHMNTHLSFWPVHPNQPAPTVSSLLALPLPLWG
jgi:cytochrome c553